MMKKFLLISVVSAIIFCSAAVSFSSEKAENPPEVKTENAEVKAEAKLEKAEIEKTDAKAENAAKAPAALLAEVLDKYNPEDFLSCRMYGNPEPVKDKPNTFNINVRVSFNEKFYRESFLPDLINLLDKIAMPTKKKGSSIAVYSGRESSSARFYKFKDDESFNIIIWQFEKFHDKINSINGVELEFFNRETQALEKIDKKIDMIFLSYATDSIIKPAITVDGEEHTIFTIPFTLKMPAKAIPTSKELSLYFLHAEKPRRSGNGWLGVQIEQSGNFVYISDFSDNSPAYNAGLRKYDGILSINGRELKSEDDFVNFVGNLNAGDVIVIEVQRVSERKTFSVTLGTRPE